MELHEPYGVVCTVLFLRWLLSTVVIVYSRLLQSPTRGSRLVHVFVMHSHDAIANGVERRITETRETTLDALPNRSPVASKYAVPVIPQELGNPK